MEIDMASTIALDDEIAELRRQLEEANGWKDTYHRLCTLTLEAFTVNEDKIDLLADLQAEVERLKAENDALRAAARPFVRAGEVIGEVRMSREDHYLWVQSHSDPKDDVKISLTDCDRLRDAVEDVS